MKYYGMVGYALTQETAPGVWEEVITERPYYGDVIKLSRRLETGTGLNDNVNVGNSISIISDPFALDHFQNIRYVTWMRSKWKVSNVDVDFPRLTLTIGGVYSEQTAHRSAE